MNNRIEINETVEANGKGLAAPVCLIESTPGSDIGVFCGTTSVPGFPMRRLYVQVTASHEGLLALLTVEEAANFALLLSKMVNQARAETVGQVLQ